MSAAVADEACYCGLRWSVNDQGHRFCAHCDREPLVRRPTMVTNGVQNYAYTCEPGCRRCTTVDRKVWQS